MYEHREREAHAIWEKKQWAAGKVERKVRDRPKARRAPPPAPLPELPLHPTEGATNEIKRMLKASLATAKERGKRRAARKARAWR